MGDIHETRRAGARLDGTLLRRATVSDPATSRYVSGRDVCVRSVTVDEVDLFLFSAACWLPHRIHYDRSFALGEGLADVPVHGPLQATWLSDMVAGWADGEGGRLRGMTTRNLLSTFPGDRLTCVATIASAEPSGEDSGAVVSLDLAVRRDDVELVTAGTAVVEVPGPSRDGR
ncbi:MaoC/PaaZ C-terminal domain-containing protein [Actinophytocola sp.]|uniref:MaoC/PaaZ C-terminal domain-containing protein n=1 Tax=Actinophytocola sp. TaxID=1872138 RepID=UPI003D6C46A8